MYCGNCLEPAVVHRCGHQVSLPARIWANSKLPSCGGSSLPETLIEQVCCETQSVGLCCSRAATLLSALCFCLLACFQPCCVIVCFGSTFHLNYVSTLSVRPWSVRGRVYRIFFFCFLNEWTYTVDAALKRVVRDIVGYLKNKTVIIRQQQQCFPSSDLH